MQPALLSQVKLLLTTFVFLVFTPGCTLTLNWSSLSQERETGTPPAAALPMPSPDFSPEQVVRIQLEALQHNDETNQGIATTFNFASPGNRKYTGPLPRFIKLLQDPHYRPMLNHKAAEFDPIKISGDTALQRVKLTAKNGQMVIYIFSLSKQTEAPYQNCWMTDGVVIEPVKELPKSSA
jgi:hypothetical protein